MEEEKGEMEKGKFEGKGETGKKREEEGGNGRGKTKFEEKRRKWGGL